MIFNHFKKFLRLPKKETVLGCVIFSAILFLIPHISHAFIGEETTAGIINFISEQLLKLTAWILGLSGLLLKGIMELSIMNIHTVVENEGVRAAWKVFRDLANMSFIFILLYSAINMILGMGDHHIKQMISRIVIVALLLNFSFFFTKVAVDASNIIAIGFYNQIVKAPCAANDSGRADDLGSAFACKLKFSSIYDSNSATSAIKSSGGNTLAIASKFLLVAVFGSVFFLITAFVFGAAALMFIARFITLIFLFILSPLAFISMVIPGYSSKWEQWLHSLINNCVFPGAFLAMTWAVLRMTEALTKPTGSTSLADAIMGGPDGKMLANSGTIFLNFAILIGMIVGTLIVAKETGAWGADGALKMLKTAKNGVQGAIMRNTVGRAGYAVDKKLGKTWVGNTSLGRVTRSLTTGALAEAKFGDKTNFKKADKAKKKADIEYANTKLEKRQAAAKKEATSIKGKTEIELTAAQMARAEAAQTKETALNKHRTGVMKNQDKIINNARTEAEKAKQQAETAKNSKSKNYSALKKIADTAANKLATEEAVLEKMGEQEEKLIEELANIKNGNTPVTVEEKHTKEAEKKFVTEYVAAGADKYSSNQIGKGAVVGAAWGTLAGPIGTVAGAAVGAGIGGILKLTKYKSAQHKLVVEAMRANKKHKEKGNLEEDLKKLAKEHHLGDDDHGHDDHGDHGKDKGGKDKGGGHGGDHGKAGGGDHH